MKFFILFIVTFFVNADLPLFEYYPNLKLKLAHVSFCSLPTPIHKLENLCAHLKHTNIYIKRDDLTGSKLDNGKHLFGGNKPRKLEFLLADALKQNAKTIITYGCAGSNHALATAVYANKLGMQSILMLKNQPNSKTVRHNLLLDKYYGAQFQFYPSNETRDIAAKLLSRDESIYFFPTGGSVALGTIGFVNAAFELKEQIDKGIIPSPDLIYLPIGSCGTTAGLLLGLMGAKLNSKIVAVAVEHKKDVNGFKNSTKKLFHETNKLLNSLDKSFLLYDFPKDKIEFNKEYSGPAYGVFTKEAVGAKKLLETIEDITLDGTYSSKAMAALIDDTSKLETNDKVILFWNTYCGTDYSELTRNINYKDLPQEFHKYFEENVQELDK